jgi:hypothetical protein
MPKESTMTTRRFLTTAGIGLLGAATALALAEILDAHGSVSWPSA